MTVKNQFKTAVLLAMLTALLLFAGSFFGRNGLIFAGIFVVLMNFSSYWFSHKIVLWMYRAKEAKEKDYPQFYKVVKEISRLSSLPMPKVYVIPTNSPNAFATGRNPNNAAVAATEGILKILDEGELKGVIAHEFAHIKNRDILISTVAGTIAGIISYMGNMLMWSSMFGSDDDNRGGGNMLGLILLAIITPIVASLIQLAISRSREYIADETGARFVKNGNSLADALEKIEKNVDINPMRLGSTATAHLFIANPFRNASFLNMFMTHPATKERTRRLRAMKF
ncbi:zinc metalloprotease HtpX [Candidatus Woesearchaeota archaeon]|nr:zinc metalloprotease HtpX [Candidatus Woesearchaeota archaeon]